MSRELNFPYHPHVTVAHDIEPAALDAVFDELAGYAARFEVDHFTLYMHGVDGRWRPVRDFPLTAGDAHRPAHPRPSAGGSAAGGP